MSQSRLATFSPTRPHHIYTPDENSTITGIMLSEEYAGKTLLERAGIACKDINLHKGFQAVTKSGLLSHWRKLRRNQVSDSYTTNSTSLPPASAQPVAQSTQPRGPGHALNGFRVFCPFGCDPDMSPKDLARHVRGECPNTIVNTARLGLECLENKVAQIERRVADILWRRAHPLPDLEMAASDSEIPAAEEPNSSSSNSMPP
eukprot:106207_1